MPRGLAILTERLMIRPAEEADRPRLVGLFRDEQFMVWHRALSEQDAQLKFNHMLAMCDQVSFAKQPVIERASGIIVGYVGVDWFDYGGERCLEFGWRLAPEFRGAGYATEASQALLDRAGLTYTGEVFALIHAENAPSHNVARKLGFELIGRASVQRSVSSLYRMNFGS